jgi:hypothetical protein
MAVRQMRRLTRTRRQTNKQTTPVARNNDRGSETKTADTNAEATALEHAEWEELLVSFSSHLQLVCWLYGRVVSGDNGSKATSGSC